MAGRYDFICEQGSTFTRRITWKDSTDAPINLTGYTGIMQVRPSASDVDTPIVELSTSNSRMTLGGAAGTVDLSISATDTSSLPVEQLPYVYDLFLTSATGIVTRLLRGNFTVALRVSK